MKNFISILITNYNKGKFLDKTLRSIDLQSFKNYEVIIYDDCSTDNSIEIIKKFKNIKLIKNLKKNTNPCPRNQIYGTIKCFNKSRGNLICLLDADDFFFKKKLQYVNDFFKKNEELNCLFNLPKSNRAQFNMKIKKNKGSIWPTIFPTSCISFRRGFFMNFIRYAKVNNYQHLEIDSRITIFSSFFYEEYNVLNRKLTIYNYDENGITANINKLSLKWWHRRKEAYLYLKFIMRSKNKTFLTSLDYKVTNFVNAFIK